MLLLLHRWQIPVFVTLSFTFPFQTFDAHSILQYYLPYCNPDESLFLPCRETGEDGGGVGHGQAGTEFDLVGGLERPCTTTQLVNPQRRTWFRQGHRHVSLA